MTKKLGYQERPWTDPPGPGALPPHAERHSQWFGAWWCKHLLTESLSPDLEAETCLATCFPALIVEELGARPQMQQHYNCAGHLPIASVAPAGLRFGWAELLEEVRPLPSSPSDDEAHIHNRLGEHTDHGGRRKCLPFHVRDCPAAAWILRRSSSSHPLALQMNHAPQMTSLTEMATRHVDLSSAHTLVDIAPTARQPKCQP